MVKVDIGFFGILRLLRTLRPLRVISHIVFMICLDTISVLVARRVRDLYESLFANGHQFVDPFLSCDFLDDFFFDFKWSVDLDDHCFGDWDADFLDLVNLFGYFHHNHF